MVACRKEGISVCRVFYVLVGSVFYALERVLAIECHHLYAYGETSRHYHTLCQLVGVADSPWHLRRFIRGILSPFFHVFIHTGFFLLVMSKQIALIDSI